MSFIDLEANPRDQQSLGVSNQVLNVQENEVVSCLRLLEISVKGLSRKISLLGTVKDDQSLRDTIEGKDIPYCEELRDSLQSNLKFNWKDKYVSDFQALSAEFLKLKREYQTRKLELPLKVVASQNWSARGRKMDGSQTASTTLSRPYEEEGSSGYISMQIKNDEHTPLLQQQQPRQELQQFVKQDQVLQDELDFHTLIQEVRSQEITKIHSQVQDVNAIFKQLGSLVHEQGKQVDSIDQNINGLTSNLQNASHQLRKADKYQRKRNKCGTVTLCIVAMVTLVVILAVVS
ncbi:HCL458Wp [Eremothecium sinecaudum]|uniref:HCL458Wp n=1 Tax=Eremothecium sinecaudum TaxID=45286 RepID=A0A109UY56_9SACH|nr:HCL458Wp [Eremothecium sinecaudum]AMD19693.1 HCL458Wp [Eremothecium sinecaudum]